MEIGDRWWNLGGKLSSSIATVSAAWNWWWWLGQKEKEVPSFSVSLLGGKKWSYCQPAGSGLVLVMVSGWISQNAKFQSFDVVQPWEGEEPEGLENQALHWINHCPWTLSAGWVTNCAWHMWLLVRGFGGPTLTLELGSIIDIQMKIVRMLRLVPPKNYFHTNVWGDVERMLVLWSAAASAKSLVRLPEAPLQLVGDLCWAGSSSIQERANLFVKPEPLLFFTSAQGSTSGVSIPMILMW